MSEYEKQLDEWKAKHGLSDVATSNPDEMRMAAEEQVANGKSWCLSCDKEMPILEMKLITRHIDPYVQIDEGETDYIRPFNRVRMCPGCFKEKYIDGII